MKRGRTFNTLFLISSVDGRITTGENDERDIDKDFPKLKQISKGLSQYYELEQRTDYHSFNTGKVLAKIGFNDKNKKSKKIPVTFIIVDNKPHLTEIGVMNLMQRGKKVIIVTNNSSHPAFKIKSDDLETIHYTEKKFTKLFELLKKRDQINRVTIQSGGTMNATLIRQGLIDRLSLVVAPALIGGKNTSTLIDGEPLKSQKDLKCIKSLKLKKVERLKNSYLHLVYDVVN